MTWRKARQAALARADHACERCKKSSGSTPGWRLHVHHDDEDRKNNALGNLQVLCPACHAREHADRWMAANPLVRPSDAEVAEARKLQFIRKFAGVKACEIARRLSVCPTLLSNFERGHRTMPVAFKFRYIGEICNIQMERAQTLSEASR